MRKLKLCVVGFGRHGKDTVCEYLEERHGYKFVSSSYFVCKRAVYPALSDAYKDHLECYRDRHNHRALWFELIKFYNKDDKTRLTRELMAEYDIYCGLRNYDELELAKEQKVFDFVVWVDACQRLPKEDASSMTVNVDQADYIVNNNGTLNGLYDQIEGFLAWAEMNVDTTNYT